MVGVVAAAVTVVVGRLVPSIGQSSSIRRRHENKIQEWRAYRASIDMHGKKWSWRRWMAMAEWLLLLLLLQAARKENRLQVEHKHTDRQASRQRHYTPGQMELDWMVKCRLDGWILHFTDWCRWRWLCCAGDDGAVGPARKGQSG